MTLDPLAGTPWTAQPMVLRCLPDLPTLRRAFFVHPRPEQGRFGIRGTYLGDAKLFEDAVRLLIPDLIRNYVLLEVIELEEAVCLRRVTTEDGFDFVSQYRI